MHSGVLFISPSADDAKALSEMLSGVGIACAHARDVAQARNMLRTKGFGAVVTEARLPDGSWHDVLGAAGRTRRRIAVVVTDLLADAHFWADVLDGGAFDLLPKPFCCSEVQRILASAVDRPASLTRAAPAA
jgi:DNA-binding NtrC family response regulator